MMNGGRDEDVIDPSRIEDVMDDSGDSSLN